jgi:hypothetical protein
MQYIVLMEFVPGVSQIWVARLKEGDPDYIFDTEEEAQAKADELKAADPTERQYKVVPLTGDIAL